MGQYPSQLLSCASGAINKTANMTMENYMNVSKAIIDNMDSRNNVARDAACLVRLAGHDFMDFRFDAATNTSSGGSDGCVNFNDPDNAGLASCVFTTDI